MSELSLVLRTPNSEWLFLVSLGVIFILVGFAIFWRRRRQLRRWNLRTSPVSPSTAAHLWVLTIFTVLTAASLVWIVFSLDIAPEQRDRDIAFGVMGIVIGFLSCIWLLNWAKQSYLRGSGQ